ncbi:hypothetical protein NERG_01823 [Nematocida ausubeli]|uniref:Uncharacterized protein n=1 Tax=Nematocida ausubeli (strain ATCC PRA-371 / ERTm2) TaxID=1913371 RepID=H8ZE02_NEMA1|nr:hypothetical protein NERG_01823 [Nematocida ausubeli]
MNEKILGLQEPVLSEYVENLLPVFEQRKQELIILVTNMPQKHSFANHICEELLQRYTKERIVELEVEMLKYASKDYFLITNACVYLERRWNSALIQKILKEAAGDEERYNILLSLTTEPSEEDVCNDFTVDVQITLPEGFEKLKEMYLILTDLRARNIIQSVRDAFTAYKIIMAYNGNIYYTLGEINALIDLESVAFGDALGGLLLGILYKKEEITYFSNILIRLLKRNKMHTHSFIQLLLTAYNLKDAIWEKLQDVVPHLYIRLGADRKLGTCLLYTLNLRNAVFLYEIMNGDVPEIEIFDKCVEGKESTPDESVRAAVREVISIPHEETYSTPCGVEVDLSASTDCKPPVRYSEVEDKIQFCAFFIKHTAPTITHLNNISVEYKDVIKNMTEQEIAVLVGCALAQKNSLVHKELLVNKIYRIRTN